MNEKIMEVLAEFNEELVEDLDRDLIASEILDSFDIVKLVVELEEAFDITIDVDLVTPENFLNVKSIIEMVKSITE